MPVHEPIRYISVCYGIYFSLLFVHVARVIFSIKMLRRMYINETESHVAQISYGYDMLRKCTNY